jgi:drug/metabolite transporter (DMT)-like permease
VELLGRAFILKDEIRMMESIIVIISEIALSLYPILIKTVPTTLNTQLVSRFAVFTALAALMRPSALLELWGTPGAAAHSTGLGLLTLTHVASSYYAFQQLPTGPAISLFYTYPMFNILAGAIFLGESVRWFDLLLIALAFIGVLCISYGTLGPEGPGPSPELEKKEINWRGISSALLAAITEVAMYFAVKTSKAQDPFYSTLELYPGALAAMMLLLGTKTIQPIDMSATTWLPMVIFNALIGFVGYNMRFYAIPKMSTSVFSILSYFGVVASFIFGWLFVKEVPTTLSMIGAALITIAASLA